MRAAALCLAALVLALFAAGRAQAAPDADQWASAGGGLFPGRPLVGATPSAEADHAGDLLRVPEPAQPYGRMIEQAARRYGLDPKLLHALVIVESGYEARAVSPAGAAGLAQLMPATASELGVSDRFDAAQSLEAGAAYLARQVIRFGDLRLALAAYNAGPARVARAGRLPEIEETQAYVVSVIDCYLALGARRAVTTSKACRTTPLAGRSAPTLASPGRSCSGGAKGRENRRCVR